MRTRTRRLATAALALGCAAFPAAAHGAVIVVTPGTSIQAAVDSAGKGDTVKVLPGTYTEKGRKCPSEKGHVCAVVVNKDGISLVAQSTKKHPVVLKRKGDQDEGIAVGKSRGAKCLTDKGKRIHGALVQGFTVKSFKDDGVFLYCVDNWRVTKVRAIGNDEYGIFPSHSGKGRIDHSFASGANDTGIYVGQSHDVRVTRNTAKHNVSGFELENTSRVRADHNTSIGNTAGLLTFELPNLDVKVNRNNRVDHNTLRANNKKNTCEDPEDLVCKVPPGIGIGVVAADFNTIESNNVTQNETTGIGVANYCIVTGAGSTSCNTDIEPNPDHDRVLSNSAHGNGKHPGKGFEVFGHDLAWDTTGQGNCWAGNSYDSSFPKTLPAC